MPVLGNLRPGWPGPPHSTPPPIVRELLRLGDFKFFTTGPPGKPLISSLVAQIVKHLPTMQETQVQSLSWEDPLEKEMAPHPLQYSCLENPMDGGAW